MKDLLPYCKYYHGEEKCPYEHDTPQRAFWIYERSFVLKVRQQTEIYNIWSKYDKEEIPKTLHSSPEKCAIYSFVTNMIGKWIPEMYYEFVGQY